MSDTRLIVAAENPYGADCLALIAELTGELSARYDDDGGASSFTPDDALVPSSAFLVARVDGQPVGCGAIRPLDSATAEVKRMYVSPKARGRGVGRQILRDLESRARQLGYALLPLETGLKQPEAIGLYESEGYVRVECYGKYSGNPLSVCFEKRL